MGMSIKLRSANRSSSESSAPAAAGGDATPVTAQMPGVVLKTIAKQGDQVNAGDTLLVLEAMKMEVSVASPCSGTVQKILVKQGEQVANGQQLALVG